jgi:hypothetical protein
MFVHLNDFFYNSCSNYISSTSYIIEVQQEQYVVWMLTSSSSVKQIPKLEVAFRYMFQDFENYVAMNMHKH